MAVPYTLALLGPCAACRQGGVTKLLYHRGSVAEAARFGQPSIVPAEGLWTEAWFRETPLGGMAPGRLAPNARLLRPEQSAEVMVAVGGKPEVDGRRSDQGRHRRPPSPAQIPPHRDLQPVPPWLPK
jgi:hypothetical protein